MSRKTEQTMRFLNFSRSAQFGKFNLVALKSIWRAKTGVKSHPVMFCLIKISKSNIDSGVEYSIFES